MSLLAYFTSASNRLFSLFARSLIVMLLTLLSMSASADEAPTKILNHSVITSIPDLATTQHKQDPSEFTARVSRGIEFNTQLNKVWILVNYIAEVSDINSKGETKLSVMPDGLPVKMGNGYIIYKAEEMADYSEELSSMIAMSNNVDLIDPDPSNPGSYYFTSRPMNASDEHSHRTSLKEAEALVNSQPNKKLVQKVSLIEFDSSLKAWREMRGTDFGFSIERITNMSPVSLEVIVGEGEIPPEIEFYLKEKNGGWFSQHKKGVIFSIVIALALLARRYFS